MLSFVPAVVVSVIIITFYIVVYKNQIFLIYNLSIFGVFLQVKLPLENPFLTIMVLLHMPIADDLNLGSNFFKHLHSFLANILFALFLIVDNVFGIGIL
jgi:hypothetical protein